MVDKSDYGPVALRLVLGLMFVLPGFDKLMGMIGGGHMVVNMLWGVAALGWLLALVEILFGLSILAGWKLEWTVWPVAAVLAGAIFMVVLPGRADNPMWMINLLFHLAAIAGLFSLSVSGPGKWAVNA
ncbi:DoxX family protein [Candidatus Woesearchaeota archaeon]|nr:DoxX family protein [Candidatus Woesearchaeota archaeon]